MIERQPSPRKRNVLLVLLATLTVAAALLTLMFVTSPPPPDAGSSSPDGEAAGEAGDPAPFEMLAEASQGVIHKLGPAVVSIEVRQEGNPPEESIALEHMFGSGDEGSLPTLGSGVMVDADGLILTSAHVVQGAQRLVVHLPNGRVVGAELVGTDAPTDLAVLKVDVKNHATTEWGDSDDLVLGDFVWAIGSPYGLEGSASLGIISAKRRRLPSLPRTELLQTDSAINPGSSGGPLGNRHGEVVGIVTAIVGGNHQGVGFAIPSNRAREAYRKVLAKHNLDRRQLEKARRHRERYGASLRCRSKGPATRNATEGWQAS